MRVDRYPENPLITPADVPPSSPGFEVICAFNAGVARYQDEIILLMRVAEKAIGDEDMIRIPVLDCSTEIPHIRICQFPMADPKIDFKDPRFIRTPDGIYLTSISHLRIARSRDGRHFTVDPKPALFPDRHLESYGIEDPRITEIDGAYYITYKSVSPDGISTSLAMTTDFINFKKMGIILPPENLDACIFPEKVNGRYVMLHRPVPYFLGALNMWIGYSPDLVSWGDHRFLMGVQLNGWENGRIGGGAVPIKTERGWLEIYHAATKDDYYCLGAVLLDLNEPHKVIARSLEPILRPEADYEVNGFVPNVVFTCGALVDGDRLSVYYGCADTSMAGADFSIREILDSLW